MISRISSMLVASVVIVAWFAVAIRADHELSAGEAVPSGGLPTQIAELKTRAGFAHRLTALRAATFINPDVTPELQIATDFQLRSFPGDQYRALKLAESLAHREPQNLTVWAVILTIQRFRHDSAGIDAAIAQLRRLDPLDVR